METTKIQQADVGLLDSFSDWNTFWKYMKEKALHPGVQKYSKNTAWMFGAKISSITVSFIATAYIARNLGPGNFGQLSYAVSFVSIFSILSTLGIDSILYRDLIKHPDKKSEFLGSALTIKLLAGFLTAVIVSISAFVWADNDVSKILILILSGTFIFNAFQIINYEFQSRADSKYPSIISFLVTVILNVLKIVVIASKKGVIYLAFILLLESILYAIFYWFAYKKKIQGKISEWKFDKDIAITLLKDSWPMIFSGAFALIYSRIDQIFIKHMMDAHAVGIYDSAVRVAEIWYFIPNIIMSSLFPAIINAKITSREIYINRLKKLGIFLFVLAFIIALLTSLFAPLIIKILYGDAFSEGIFILQIYAWSIIGSFLGNLITNYLIAENYRKISFLINFLPMLVNVILNIIWIPIYGIAGAAYATLISYSLSPIILFIFKNTREEMVEIIKV